MQPLFSRLYLGPMTFVVVPQEALLGRLWGLCQARSW